jgi:hypothetical protein
LKQGQNKGEKRIDSTYFPEYSRYRQESKYKAFLENLGKSWKIRRFEDNFNFSLNNKKNYRKIEL